MHAEPQVAASGVTTSELPSYEKVILIGGIKRSGTSLMRNLIGSHSQIAIPPIEFGFFIDFDVADFDRPGGYARAVERFLAGSRPARWSLNTDYLATDGSSAKDFYCAALNTFRRSVKPHARYIGDKSTFIEFRFDTYRRWFGVENIRFIHMLRNPIDCFASTKRMPDRLSRHPSYQVYHFCDMWMRSALMGLTLAQRYPQSYRVVRYEDLVAKPGEIVADLCHWIGVPEERERMLAAADYQRKDNSSFGDLDRKGTGREGSVVKLKPGSRADALMAAELRALRSLGSFGLLRNLDYDGDGNDRGYSAEALAGAGRLHLNLAGLRGVVPAYLRLLGVGAGTIVTMILDRLRDRVTRRRSRAAK